MLKFIDDNDFLLVDKYKQNDDGSISWVYNDGNATHSGFIREGMTRVDGDETVDVWAKLQSKIASKAITVEGKTQEEFDAEQVAEFKASRELLIANSVVTTESGNKYDADNGSIQKMVNKILSYNYAGKLDTDTLEWSLADTGTGVMTTVTLGELKEAHHLSVEYVQSVWGL